MYCNKGNINIDALCDNAVWNSGGSSLPYAALL